MHLSGIRGQEHQHRPDDYNPRSDFNEVHDRDYRLELRVDRTGEDCGDPSYAEGIFGLPLEPSNPGERVYIAALCRAIAPAVDLLSVLRSAVARSALPMTQGVSEMRQA
jgi:hypothetical protein